MPQARGTVPHQLGRAPAAEAARPRALTDVLSRTCEAIVDLHVDAIVNAANKNLEDGGGLCGAIHRGAGERLYAACIQLGGCRTGDVKATPGFCLPARFIFHAVGPTADEDIKLLASCYRRCLQLAQDMNLRSIAFPCISTGIYAVDPDLAADIAMRTVCDWLNTVPISRPWTRLYLRSSKELTSSAISNDGHDMLRSRL